MKSPHWGMLELEGILKNVQSNLCNRTEGEFVHPMDSTPVTNDTKLLRGRKAIYWCVATQEKDGIMLKSPKLHSALQAEFLKGENSG